MGISTLCGSIPASAGQPIHHLAVPTPSRVYPRECGAAVVMEIDEPPSGGLSPRVRGSRHIFLPSLLRLGSIPASAGQPVGCMLCGVTDMVYPRECGAAVTGYAGCTSSTGLSPRVRGSQRHTITLSAKYRSIPASAGQPSTSSLPASKNSVYPRECGAADGG